MQFIPLIAKLDFQCTDLLLKKYLLLSIFKKLIISWNILFIIHSSYTVFKNDHNIQKSIKQQKLLCSLSSINKTLCNINIKLCCNLKAVLYVAAREQQSWAVYSSLSADWTMNRARGDMKTKCSPYELQCSGQSEVILKGLLCPCAQRSHVRRMMKEEGENKQMERPAI